MFNHAPEEYICPFCTFLQDGETEGNHPHDIVYQDSLVTAFIAPRWWPRNEGYVLVIPNEHFENIYDLPRKYAHRIQDLAQEVAIAFKQVYHCDGISTRQHNKPAGNQDVWHYHLHVFPRYKADDLYRSLRSSEDASLEKRNIYASKLQTFFATRDLSW